jgi:NADH-quinone oxidoreductase subunit H
MDAGGKLMDTTVLLATIIKALAVFGFLMQAVPIMTWVERRGSAIIQLRLGPNRVGPFGLFQPLADGIKSLWKEWVVPPEGHAPTFNLAPIVSCCAAFVAFSVIPFGNTITIGEHVIPLTVVDIDAGVLVLLAASGLGVYGIIMAGWASNSKYSQLGGLRSSSQMISYELALGLAVISVLVLSGTLDLNQVVRQQAERGVPNIVFLPLGAMILFVSGYAETNRAPFDLPEAESELVAGYHTEYSSLGFAIFAMAEYVNMITASALFVTLFLGGYAVPQFIAGPLGLQGNWLAAAEVVTFLAKVGFFMWVYVWVRWTLPRFRFDQLMRIGWKLLIPLAILNIVWAAAYVAFGIVK